jgi:hypothetical protein
MNRVPVCDLLAAAYAVADWSGVRALFVQCREVHATGLPVPVDLRDRLAACLSDLAASYPGREEPFIEHAGAVFAEAAGHETLDQGVFQTLYDDRWGSDRLPAAFEAVVETARRLRDLNRLRTLLWGTGTSGGLCGSVSHAPFYNVRADSDLDVLIFVDNPDALPGLVEKIAALRAARPASVERLRARAVIYRDRYDDGMTVFSHKLVMDGDYRLSLHALTIRTLAYVLVESSTTLTRATAGSHRGVRDYRDTTTSRPDRTRSFGGREHKVTSVPEPAEFGWLRWVTVYRFDDADSYCPGFLQTILQPRFELLWDDLGCASRLRVFERKYLGRLRYEQAREPHALLLPSLTHVRRDGFAPHVVAEFDRSVPVPLGRPR